MRGVAHRRAGAGRTCTRAHPKCQTPCIIPSFRSAGSVRGAAGTLSLPVGRPNRHRFGAARGCCPRRRIYPARRIGCLESSGAAHFKGSSSADRNDAAGADRRRQSCASWCCIGRAAASGMLRPVGIRRRRSGLCRNERDLWHGRDSRACSVESNGSGLTGSIAGQ